MHVLKFGGSSVADATNISKVLDIVTGITLRDRVILVCSAIKGCTDTLINEGATPALLDRHEAIVNRLFTGNEREAAKKELRDEFAKLKPGTPNIEAYGEILSTKIIARKLVCDGINALWIDSRQLVRAENCKVIGHLTYPYISAIINNHPEIDVFVAPGFICTDTEGNVQTLGRGGSDYSAAIYAAGCNASDLEIWTDVPGIMTTNPKDVPSAKTISNISYKAALDLATYGAKVLYPPTVIPAMETGVAINIRNTFDPANPGTVISDRFASEIPVWKGLACCRDGESTVLHLVGEGNLKLKSALERACTTLKKAGIQITGSGTEDGSLRINVHPEQEREALAAIHREFFETKKSSSIDIYIAGYGAVGKALVKIIDDSAANLAERFGKKVRICGISNSRQYVIDREGIAPNKVAERLSRGLSGKNFAKAVMETASRGAVFVDCSNSETIQEYYCDFFRNGLSVVSSNRRALAVPYAKYSAMKSTALENGASFRFDTTVGAAIPILESFASESVNVESLESIEAVISCTLNNIITGYDGANTESFATLLKKAQLSGLTEMDPRTDLEGKDALRKILILAREAGIPLEKEDVEITPMLDEKFFNCSLDEFYRLLEEDEPEFIAREKELDDLGQRQRFVASVVRDPDSALGFKASIKMQLVGIENPFYWISGSENIVSIKSNYSPSPLTLRGSGEGARLAASGILNNILEV